MANDYDAKKALKDAEDYKRAHNGKADPSLEALAKSECAALKLEYNADNVIQPLWLRNS